MTKTKSKKTRINLYIDLDVAEFGKKLASVKNTSLSRMFEKMLSHERDRVNCLSADQYFEEKNKEAEQAYLNSYEYTQARIARQEQLDYFNDQEDIEFCRINPDHPRAKIRLQLIKKYEEEQDSILERMSSNLKEREIERVEFRQRWEKTFSKK